MERGDLAIRAREIEVTYPGGPTVLADVDFDVKAGEIFAILGASGSGKTTLLRVILGLLPPTRGAVEIAGHRLDQDSQAARSAAAREIGVLFQTGALFASLTLAENVMLPIRTHTRLPVSTAQTMALLKLALVGLGNNGSSLPAEISGGMRKRAGIARAMALDPQILILDEPSSGLDPVTARELDELILALNRSLGITVVMVTHDLASAFQVATRCILIDRETKGIAAQGAPEALREHAEPRVRAFFERECRRSGE